MSKRKAKGNKGNGIGPWQAHGAMARATRTPNKRERERRRDRAARQGGWKGD